MVRRTAHTSLPPEDVAAALTPALIELVQAAVTAETTNAAELAEILHRSANTVRNQLTQVCKALGCRSRAGAIIRAIKLGIVNLDSPSEAVHRSGTVC
jgi:DNA-binding NarL/FixJ family response regulator